MSPLYSYICVEHGAQTVIKPMAEASDPEWCPRCERPMERQLDAVHARVKGGTKLYHGVRG